MSTCENLATKGELAELRIFVQDELKKYIPVTQKKTLINEGGLAGFGLVAPALAAIGLKAANAGSVAKKATTLATVATSTASVANISAIRATKSASKAAFDALLAGKQSAKAISAAGSAGKTAGKALGQAANAFSLATSAATAVAMAAIAVQVSRNISDIKAAREEDKKIRLEIKQTKVAVLQQVEINRKILQQNQSITQENRKILDKTDAIARNNQKRLDQLDSRIESFNTTVQTVKEQVASVQQTVQQTNDAIAKNNAEIERLSRPQPVPDNSATNAAIKEAKDIAAANAATNAALKRQLDTLTAIQTLQRAEELSKLDGINNVKIRSLNDKIERFDLANSQLKSSLNSDINTLKSSVNSDINTLQSSIKSDINTLQDSLTSVQFQTNTKVNSLDKTVSDIQVQNNDAVNNQQFTKLDKKLDQLVNNQSNLANPVSLGVAVASLPIIKQIAQNTGRISPCQAPVLVPPVAVQARANGAATTGLQVINTGQNLAIQNTVNAVQQSTNTIGQTLLNPTYGLQAIQNFASNAWKFTKADKALGMLNTVLLINNAIYLGQNIGETIGDSASLVLSSMGIKDAEGSPISVNEVIGNTVKSWITSVIGAGNYQAIQQKFAQSNRTYQAASNLYGGIRNMMATAEDIAEETGIDVAKIGNALRDSGAVESDSYERMSERPRKFNKIISALEKADEAASSFNSITQDAQDFSEEITEFRANKKEFEESLLKEKVEVKRAEQINERRLESLPEPTQADKLASEDNQNV